MTPDIVESGIKVWLGMESLRKNIASRLSVIFYGGEPLLNPAGIFAGLEFIRTLEDTGRLEGKVLEKRIITNGTLVEGTPREVLRQFKEMRVGVTVSLDGPRWVHDAYRKSQDEKGSFGRIIKGLTILKEAGIEVGLSVTLTPLSIMTISETVALAEKFDVKGIGVNPLIGQGMRILQDIPLEKYVKQAAQASVTCFHKAREVGIREDRVSDKRDALSGLGSCVDCLVPYGGQLAVWPDGTVGVCQALKEISIGNVGNDPPVMSRKREEIATIWAGNLPMFRGECSECGSRAICGGGCAFSALTIDGSLSARDNVLCEYTKKIHQLIVSENAIS